MVGDNLYRILDSAADELLLHLEEAGKICRAKNRYVTIYRDLGRWNLEDGARPQSCEMCFVRYGWRVVEEE